MAPFRFPLKRVLELRKEFERRSALGLAQARSGAEAAHRAKEGLEAAREAGRNRLAAAHGVGGRVGHLQNLAVVVRHLEEQIREADVACREADQQVVESLRSFHVALRERRTIEELEAKKLDEWRAEEGRAEQKTLDESALSRHARAGFGTTQAETDVHRRGE